MPSLGLLLEPLCLCLGCRQCLVPLPGATTLPSNDSLNNDHGSTNCWYFHCFFNFGRVWIFSSIGTRLFSDLRDNRPLSWALVQHSLWHFLIPLLRCLRTHSLLPSQPLHWVLGLNFVWCVDRSFESTIGLHLLPPDLHFVGQVPGPGARRLSNAPGMLPALLSFLLATTAKGLPWKCSSYRQQSLRHMQGSKVDKMKQTVEIVKRQCWFSLEVVMVKLSWYDTC